MAFNKTGAIFTIKTARQINGIDEWNKVAGRQLRSSNVEGISTNNNQALLDGNSDGVVCEIDPSKYIYIHTTIMASVDLEDDKSHYITRETEKYINSNSDAWTRAQLLNDYPTFMQVGTVFVEHDQNPEKAKGKVLDAIARDMGDTILIDLLFCVDRRHADLVANIESGIANAVSMGCSTGYTICSICGNKAHNDKEYCGHISRQRGQMVRCADGNYRKAAELCFENVFFDCSIVANPAFAGAVFRKLVAHNKVATTMLANLLNREITHDLVSDEMMTKIASIDGEASVETSRADDPNPVRQSPARFQRERDESTENPENDNAGTAFPGAGYRGASMDKSATHPIMHGDEEDYIIDDEEFSDIPWHDRHNTLPVADAQQSESMLDAGKGKKKKASIVGRLVRITADYHIPAEHRKQSMMINHITHDMVGRVISKQGGEYSIYFPRIGTVHGIPHTVIADFQDEFEKSARMDGKDGILVNHKGAFIGSEDRFQVLDSDDDNVVVRYLSGRKMGEVAVVPKSEFTKGKVKWANATSIKLASFKARWNGEFYKLSTAHWNEKHAGIIDRVEPHLDSIQNDITCAWPMSEGRYANGFSISSRHQGVGLRFEARVNGDDLELDVSTHV